MTGTVSISKERYDELLECERFRDKRKFSKEFVRDLEDAEKQVRAGSVKEFNSWNEMEEYLDSL